MKKSEDTKWIRRKELDSLRDPAKVNLKYIEAFNRLLRTMQVFIIESGGDKYKTLTVDEALELARKSLGEHLAVVKKEVA